ncbi:Crp/Fnr family transcriptional regulator [Thiocapsa sp.]|uniref:Crp/Fnr family transcriptional regulator n=1 Tax=Thiocapsa sp. TaxID=2024551 RepID=UPI002600D2A9|nr:Crp/Fnr family transcriptional regulator [Thiocapsa sp.]
MPNATTNPRQNRLLAALPGPEYRKLLPHLELVQLDLGETVHESGGKLRYVLFPTTAIVSLLNVIESGASAEIAVVGNDGIVGVALLMGGETMPNLAMVQSAGDAYRLSAPLLRQALTRTGGRRRAVLPPLLLRYTQSLLTQMAQTAICNRHHTVDQQLCRWLLLSLDRLPSNEIHMTQELIANMLGVRREGVTEAAGRLQRAALITYSRGRITVLDRPGLEARVCECYEVVRKEFHRLLPEVIPTRAEALRRVATINGTPD